MIPFSFLSTCYPVFIRSFLPRELPTGLGITALSIQQRNIQLLSRIALLDVFIAINEIAITCKWYPGTRITSIYYEFYLFFESPARTENKLSISIAAILGIKRRRSFPNIFSRYHVRPPSHFQNSASASTPMTFATHLESCVTFVKKGLNC